MQEEANKSSVVEQRGPKPSWIKRQPNLDTKPDDRTANNSKLSLNLD